MSKWRKCEERRRGGILEVEDNSLSAFCSTKQKLGLAEPFWIIVYFFILVLQIKNFDSSMVSEN